MRRPPILLVFALLLCSKLVHSEQPPAAATFAAHRDVHFYFYPSVLATTAKPVRLELNNITQLMGSGFKVSLETRVIIHGWYDDLNSRLSAQLREAYQRRGRPLNLLIVDWGRGARTVNYFLAKKRVKSTGVAVAAYLRFLFTANAQRPAQIALIGHSLGAHVAGVAGKHLRAGGRLASIVGLDAALPLFDHHKWGERLHSGDAEYVEGIHTNCGFKGWARPYGHADFYPNWGRRQPGCGWDVGRPCSHKRAIALFAETVAAGGGMAARNCTGGWPEVERRECTARGLGRMGGEPLVAERGVFYLPTNGAAPFALG